jgi:CRP-like cAMP-binding protein
MIFREGEPANHLYLLQSGCVVLEAHEPGQGAIPVDTLGANDVLGWSWLFPPFAWHFQARAAEPTEAIALCGAHLLVAAERDPAFGYELMKRIAQLLIHRLQSARRRLLASGGMPPGEVCAPGLPGVVPLARTSSVPTLT